MGPCQQIVPPAAKKIDCLCRCFVDFDRKTINFGLCGPVGQNCFFFSDSTESNVLGGAANMLPYLKVNRNIFQQMS